MRTRIALFAVSLAVLLPAGVAGAAQPLALDAPVTDESGVLGTETAAVEKAVAELRSSTGIVLSTVFVPSFDGEEQGADWAELTAVESGLGDDQVLLAVATDDAEYEWWIGAESTLQPNAVGRMVRERVEPAVVVGDWSGAGVALADGLRSTEIVDPAMPAWSAVRTTVTVGALVGALVGVYLLSRRGTPVGRASERTGARAS
ncbi:TPM domain-containing protein [Modestobacter roseus]|uniref:Putative membrane protein YgcG n=1 Tax=Modestobacter roseus TaxID=1181884 RepID=A0A562IRH7_9ACTN|nr:TPM domain-containing protein [Modestobacter roseus]TWH73512.1 putative membrane protein YgcG [Modestobacter roseus]